jgi:hypothetical protein
VRNSQVNTANNIYPRFHGKKYPGYEKKYLAIAPRRGGHENNGDTGISSSGCHSPDPANVDVSDLGIPVS